jgi:hypothetical protein
MPEALDLVLHGFTFTDALINFVDRMINLCNTHFGKPKRSLKIRIGWQHADLVITPLRTRELVADPAASLRIPNAAADYDDDGYNDDGYNDDGREYWESYRCVQEARVYFEGVHKERQERDTYQSKLQEIKMIMQANREAREMERMERMVSNTQLKEAAGCEGQPSFA